LHPGTACSMKALFLALGSIAAEWSTEEVREKSDTVPFFEDCWDECGGVAGPCKACGTDKACCKTPGWFENLDFDSAEDVPNGCPRSACESYHCCVDAVPFPPSPPPPPPSPPPPPPAPPPPPSPPPVKIIESKSGWGTPEQCPCSGWSSKHGFGAYCKGWELEGQTPWCYVTEACPTTMTAGGSFAHRYIQCTEVQGTLSKLLGRRLQSNGPAATARSKRLNASAKKPKAPGKPVKHATARLKTPLLPGKGVPKKRPIRHEASWAAAKSLLLRKADRLPLYALQSTENGRFVDVDPPPDKFALFAHADSTSLSLSSVFALPSSGRGSLLHLAHVSRSPETTPRTLEIVRD